MSWGESASMVSQRNPHFAPVFVADAFEQGAPAVLFDGQGTFLANTTLRLGNSITASTHFAVFRDTGSTTTCCSGVLYWHGADAGISTQRTGAIVTALADGPGVSTPGSMDVTNRSVYASATYSADGEVGLTVAACNYTGRHSTAPRAAEGVMVGSRNDELSRFFKGNIGELISYPRVLNPADVDKVRSYLMSQWPSSATDHGSSNCGTEHGDSGFRVSQMYAITRYTQAVQSRGTMWPIKFNGMAFIAAMGSNGEADSRQWGACNWWQNTRLPYGAMLTAGDADIFQVLMEYKLNQQVLLSQRTQLYWGHPGMWTPEVSHLSGAYCPETYGCNATNRKGLPVWLDSSEYIHVDQGGDSGTGEYSLMALDFLLWTSNNTATPRADAKDYLLIATEAAEYFMHHFKNRSADGRVLVWPAQVLETYWCTWDVPTQQFVNCCENDSPTVSGMIGLFEKLLALPASLTTATQRATWQRFQSHLMPVLPVKDDANGSVIAPAKVVSNGTHNGEGPELYAIHPHRLFTKGRHVAAGVDISLAERTVNASRFAQGGTGWNYGINAQALVGNSAGAAKQLLSRAWTAPAQGYRFDGFAPHEQDFDPSADHFANMNRALLEMLLQSGDDGFANTTIVLFPSWPCEWDVNFKLWGPLNTSVEVQYAGGQLLQPIIVEPPARVSAVTFANCVA
eukprot:m.70674 g.70674  ORF g.70674 m.70674 type:complete len:682 (-) comp8661_c0_seq1:95-2140(-)